MRFFTPAIASVAVTLLLILTSGCLHSTPVDETVSVELHAGSVLQMASLAEGQELIGTADDWVSSFGPFDFKVRLDSDEASGEEEFLDFARSQVLVWFEHEVQAVKEASTRILASLKALDLRLDLPDKIPLVKTTGREEGEMGGYTRGSFIVVPEARMEDLDGLEDFLLHEIFHVMTRHAPEIRKPLYELIGYSHGGPLEYPQELMPRRITNPDAYHYDAYVELEIDGEPMRLTPLTLSTSATYAGGGIPMNVGVEFLRVRTRNGRMVPERTDGELVLLRSGEMPAAYYEKLGGNTVYTIHPEEVMAENFSLAVRRQRSVRSPQLLDALVDVLAARAPERESR